MNVVVLGELCEDILMHNPNSVEVFEQKIWAKDVTVTAGGSAVYVAGGIMVDEALERFMGNEAMLERYLQKFLSEKSYAMLRDSLASNDWEAAGRAAHTLKSICGTIGCEAMQELVILQERHIRAGEWKEAVGMMPEISNSYENICGVIRA